MLRMGGREQQAALVVGWGWGGVGCCVDGRDLIMTLRMSGSPSEMQCMSAPEWVGGWVG